jgi:hypothetical protein
MTALGLRQSVSLNAGHRIESEVHLETTTGLVVGRTRTTSTIRWTTVQSAAQALVFGADGDVLFTGPLDPYDAKCTRVGQHERTDVWARRITPSIAIRARKIAIVHTWNPRWLAALPPNLLSLDALAGVLADSKMGDLTVGEEMPWPDDEPPWATWPGGRRSLQPTSAPSGAIERESHRDVQEAELVAELTGEHRA